MDEKFLKPLKTPELKGKTLAKFLKKYRIIENLYDLDEWVLTEIKIPLVDYLFDFVIRTLIFFVGLLAFYFPPPAPVYLSLFLVFTKATALSVAFGLVIKLKRELWRKK